jgi:hypothetical protein
MRDFHYGKTPNRGRKRFRRRFEPLSASAGRRTENPAFFRFSPSARRTWRASMRTIHAYTSRRSSRRGERRYSFGAKLAAATALRDSSANGGRFRAPAVTHRELCRRRESLRASRDKTLRRFTRAQVQPPQHDPTGPRVATRKRGNYVAKNAFSRHNWLPNDHLCRQKCELAT